MKKKSIVLPVILLVGLSLLLYPTVSNYWNSLHQSRAIAGYVETVDRIDTVTYQQIWSSAEEYNRAIDELTMTELTDERYQQYLQQLNITSSGIMGYIDIPKIRCTLPIYHGTDDAVLQVAVGHVEGSSLPVGGERSHCVLSGHRGLTNAKLFTNLDQLVEGDVFILSVLHEELYYEVDQISIVNPDDLSLMTFEDGMDLCTLVTCTPYGVNSHRLLVRGHRIEKGEASVVRVIANATQINRWLVTAVVASPLAMVALLCVIVRRLRR